MPKTKAGTLKPKIDQIRKEIRDKGDALAGEERRREVHRLKRLQRKARRIRELETKRAPAGKPEAAEGAAPEAS